DQQNAAGVEDVLEVDRRLRLTEDVAHSRPQQDRAQPSQYGADPAELFSLTESPKLPPKGLEPDRIVETSRPAGLQALVEEQPGDVDEGGARMVQERQHCRAHDVVGAVLPVPREEPAGGGHDLVGDEMPSRG